jgi:hypothetical protein
MLDFRRRGRKRLWLTFSYFYSIYLGNMRKTAGASGRAVYGVGLRPLASWDCGFESQRGMDVCCDCCVLSGRGLCDGLITRPEESYRLWSVVCDQETSNSRRLKPENTTTLGCNAKKTTTNMRKTTSYLK